MGFYCGCDDGKADFWRERTQVARKEYRCGECGQPILPGDTYVRIFSVYEGRGESLFNCERCNDLMAAFQSVGYCWYIGEFLDAYRDWLVDSGTPLPRWLIEIRPQWAPDA